MAMKNKKMSMAACKDMSCKDMACDKSLMCSHAKGKAFVSIGMGLLLIMFGFSLFIHNIEMLAALIGVVFCLKGAVKLMKC